MNLGSRKYKRYAVENVREINICPNISNNKDKHVKIKQ
jgi:hypothetical protein